MQPRMVRVEFYTRGWEAHEEVVRPLLLRGNINHQSVQLRVSCKKLALLRKMASVRPRTEFCNRLLLAWSVTARDCLGTQGKVEKPGEV